MTLISPAPTGARPNGLPESVGSGYLYRGDPWLATANARIRADRRARGVTGTRNPKTDRDTAANRRRRQVRDDQVADAVSPI